MQIIQKFFSTIFILSLFSAPFYSHAEQDELPQEHQIDLTQELELNVPIQAAWNQLEQIGDLSWFPGVQDADVSYGKDPTPQKTVRIITLMNGQHLKEVLVEWAPEINQITFDIVEGLPFPHYFVQFQLTKKDAKTVMSIHATGKTFPMPTPAFEGLRHEIQGLYNQALINFKEKVEAEQAQQRKLQEAYSLIRNEAVILAGAPGDIKQRVAFLYEIYLDSNKNHAFPLIALHGALWAYHFFHVTGPIGKLISLRFVLNPSEMRKRKKMLDDFTVAFQDANRSVFIDTYTNYYFSKQYGQEPGAEKFVKPDLLGKLNEMHQARKNYTHLNEIDRADLFNSALINEQEVTVSPKVKAAVDKFDCPTLKSFVLKPIVRFTYFPMYKYFWFNDFSNQAERVARATESYTIAERVGFDKVEAAIKKYRVFDRSFFTNLESNLFLLRTRIKEGLEAFPQSCSGFLG